MKCSSRKRTRGTAVVEAAIVLPVLIVLTYGIIELGWYVNSLHILHTAARQGARAAVRLENSTAQVDAAVRSSLSDSIDPNAITVRLFALDSVGEIAYEIQTFSENERGVPVRVIVTVDYAAMSPLSDVLGLATDTLNSSAVMQRKP